MEARWLLYAGADQNNQQLAIEELVLREQRLRWWIYQANDLLHHSYETLLKYGLDTLEGYRAGIALNTLIAELVSAMSEADRNWPPTWRDFLASQPPAENANGDSPNSERSLVEAIAQTSSPPQKAQLRQPCLRNELSPLSQEGHRAKTAGFAARGRSCDACGSKP
jgi:hypothetical protein